jgi:hypothetical protein
MGIEVRAGRLYYYKKARVGNRITSEYYGPIVPDAARRIRERDTDGLLDPALLALLSVVLADSHRAAVAVARARREAARIEARARADPRRGRRAELRAYRAGPDELDRRVAEPGRTGRGGRGAGPGGRRLPPCEPRPLATEARSDGQADSRRPRAAPAG